MNTNKENINIQCGPSVGTKKATGSRKIKNVCNSKMKL